MRPTIARSRAGQIVLPDVHAAGARHARTSARSLTITAAPAGWPRATTASHQLEERAARHALGAHLKETGAASSQARAAAIGPSSRTRP